MHVKALAEHPQFDFKLWASDAANVSMKLSELIDLDTEFLAKENTTYDT